MVPDPPARARLEAAHPADAPDDLALEGARAEDLVEQDLGVVRGVRVEVDVEAAAVGEQLVEERRGLVKPGEPGVEAAGVLVGGDGDARVVVRCSGHAREVVEGAPGIERRIEVDERHLARELRQGAAAGRAPPRRGRGGCTRGASWPPCTSSVRRGRARPRGASGPCLARPAPPPSGEASSILPCRCTSRARAPRTPRAASSAPPPRSAARARATG